MEVLGVSNVGETNIRFRPLTFGLVLALGIEAGMCSRWRRWHSPRCDTKGSKNLDAGRNILKKYCEVADANRCMVKASQRLRQVVLPVEEEYSWEYSCEVGCLRATGDASRRETLCFWVRVGSMNM